MERSMPAGSERPIGYWLKAADRAITARVDAVQRAEGVTRLDWQVLNTIAQSAHRSPDQIVAELHMFLDRAALDKVLTAFRTNGWIVENATGEISLTEAGRQAHARILARQQEVRQQLMQGISADEYTTALRVLQRIVANLGDPGAAETS
jgi:DNA-binding MarR family transcriptional regulator